MAHPDLNELRRVARGGAPQSSPAPRPSRPPNRGGGNWFGRLVGYGAAFWIICSGVNCWINAPQSSWPNNSPTVSQSVEPVQPPRAVAMLPAARNWVKTPIMGKWRGTFDGDAALLHVTRRDNNGFIGTLTISASKGTYRVAVRGVLAENGAVAIQETKVLRIPRGAQWTRGINVGKFANSNRTMAGHGQAPTQNAYSWSFRRAS